MCNRPKFVLALIVAMSVGTAGLGQQQIPSVTVKKVSNEDGLTLGNGVSLDKIAPAYISPFKEVKVSRVENRDPIGNIHIYLVTTGRALDIQRGVNVAAKAHYLFAKANAAGAFNRATTISEDSFRLVVIGESKYGHDELRGPVFTDGATALIKAGNMKRFSEIYGTHFVLREHRIARIALTISVDSWSDTTLRKLRVSLNGGASIELAGGELKASIQDDLKGAIKRKALNVEVSTVGGTGLQGFGDIVKGLLSNSPDFQTTLGNSVATLLMGFTRANSGIGSVTVASYQAFGWNPDKLNLWNDLFEDKLQKCADLYYAGRQVERNLRQVAIPNANPALRNNLEVYAVKYDNYLSQLADFQKALLNRDEKYVNKEFPKEPELDQESAKVLFARIRTLEAQINKLNDSFETHVQGVRKIIHREPTASYFHSFSGRYSLYLSDKGELYLSDKENPSSDHRIAHR